MAFPREGTRGPRGVACNAHLGVRQSSLVPGLLCAAHGIGRFRAFLGMVECAEQRFGVVRDIVGQYS